jgi:multiple sugar transport system ATP-binding protein
VLDVADGEFVALLGPSGCGKTTLLRIMFQNYAVFPHMTVYENIAFGLRMQSADDARVERQVARAAALLHIEAVLERYPAKLSGGQRQRVAVARALAVEPPVLLMDEPLSNLDALLRLEMRAELKAVLRAAGTTTIYVTHDQTEAMGLADRIALMHNGRIEQIDAPMQLYRQPKTKFVGGFVGSPPMNFVTVPVQAGEARLGSLALPAPIRDGTLIAGMRAEDIAINDADRGFPLDVSVAEPLGAHTLITGHYQNQQLRVMAAPDLVVAPGTRVGLTPTLSRLIWMDPASGQAMGNAT